MKSLHLMLMTMLIDIYLMRVRNELKNLFVRNVQEKCKKRVTARNSQTRKNLVNTRFSVVAEAGFEPTTFGL